MGLMLFIESILLLLSILLSHSFIIMFINRFVFVSHMDDVLKIALERPILGLEEIKGEQAPSQNITHLTPTPAD